MFRVSAVRFWIIEEQTFCRTGPLTIVGAGGLKGDMNEKIVYL